MFCILDFEHSNLFLPLSVRRQASPRPDCGIFPISPAPSKAGGLRIFDSFLQRGKNQSNAQGSAKNSNIFEYFQTFHIIFRKFSNIFKRFQTFSNVLKQPPAHLIEISVAL
jgi:hypothetical protein